MTKKAPSLALPLQLVQRWVWSLKTHTQLASSCPPIFCKPSVAWDSSLCKLCRRPFPHLNPALPTIISLGSETLPKLLLHSQRVPCGPASSCLTVRLSQSASSRSCPLPNLPVAAVLPPDFSHHLLLSVLGPIPSNRFDVCPLFLLKI